MYRVYCTEVSFKMSNLCLLILAQSGMVCVGGVSPGGFKWASLSQKILANL